MIETIIVRARERPIPGFPMVPNDEMVLRRSAADRLQTSWLGGAGAASTVLDSISAAAALVSTTNRSNTCVSCFNTKVANQCENFNNTLFSLPHHLEVIQGLR